ncbi:lipopolysaccharide biosynthesis protein [Campylobacter hyointestinalis]|uniref:lipopolysaccharide biosynthesis protein n=1 Tax=Campylobacter hyointestinalis TaxID=198 RepID=UPI000DCBD819|nr:oligosaccharide flippase family protein [Campylobacter hyointestinalis]RAZ51788.1 polysaccharide biosynthesis protein [Campylobacter hyointestinalis subsp. lawsonii]
MIKEFFKNSLIYIVGTIVTRGIGILLVPIYTRYLSPSDYGIIDLFTIVASIINLTIALEISQAIARYYQDAKGDLQKALYTSTAFWFTFVVYGAYCIVSLIFSDIFTTLLLDDSKYKDIFILATFSIATNGIFYFTQNQLKWQIQPKDSIYASLLNIVIVVVVAVLLLTNSQLKIESIFIAQILGNVIASLLAIYYAINSYKFLFDYKKLKEMISFSTPLVLSGVAIFIAMYIDRIAIKDLLGFNDLGIYGVAYRFSSVAGLVMIGFQNSITPLIFKNYNNNNTPREISTIFDIFSIFALLTICGSIIFSKEILILFTTPNFYNASQLIGLLVMISFFSNMYIFAPGITIAKKTKYVIYITITIALLNIFLNYTLIPIFGLVGSAYATLIGSIVGFFMYCFISYRFYPIPYSTKRLLISFAIVLTSSYFIENILNKIDIYSIIAKLFYFICLSLILVFLLYSKTNLKYNIFAKRS